MNKKTTYKVIVICGVVSVSVVSILAKLSTAPSNIVSLYRALFMLAIMLIPAIRQRHEFKSLPMKLILIGLGNGMLFGLHFDLYCDAVNYTNVASAAILTDSEILFVAPIMHFIFKERLSRLSFCGVGLVILGSFIVTASSMGSPDAGLHGDLLSLGAAFCLAIFTICGRKLRPNMSNTVYNVLTYCGATVMLLIITGMKGTPLTGYGLQNIAVAFAMTLFCSLGGHAVFSWSLRYVEAPFISSAKLLEPIFAAVMALFLFLEVPSIFVVIGGASIISGIVVYMKGDTEGDGERAKAEPGDAAETPPEVSESANATSQRG